MTSCNCKVCGTHHATKADADNCCVGKKERKTNKNGLYNGTKTVKTES